MTYDISRLVLLASIIMFSIACGGGGGGGGASETTTTNSTDKFFSVLYKGNALNSPTVTASVVSSVSTSLTSGKLDGATNLQGGANSSETDPNPEFLLYLKIGTHSNVPTVKYNAVVYGLHSSAVTVGTYSIDFSSSSSPSVAQTGISNSNSVSMLSELPSATTFSVNSGAVTWGSWTGGIDADSNTILLSRDNRLFLLASKVATHASSALAGKTFNTSINILQANDSSTTTEFTVASGAGPVNFNGAGSVGITTAYKFSQTNQNVSIPTGSARPWRLNSSDSSLLEISDASAFTNLTEYGFLGGSEFHVLVNPDNTDRPSLIIFFQ